MNCPKCGKETDAGAAFCGYCGAKLSQEGKEGFGQGMSEGQGTAGGQGASEVQGYGYGQSASKEQGYGQGTTEVQGYGYGQSASKEQGNGSGQGAPGSQGYGYGQSASEGQGNGSGQGAPGSQGYGYGQGTTGGQGYGYGQGAPGSQGYGGQNGQQVEKRPIPKWVFAIIAESVLMIGILVAGFQLYQKSKDMKQVAEQYFVNTANGDWEAAYGQLDVEQLGLGSDDKFINAEMFAKSQAQGSLGVVNNYQINETSELEESLYQWGEEYGLSGNQPMERAVRIDYRAEGDTSNKTYVVSLDQASGKWKVSLSGVVFQDYRIYVPMGASVSLDGVALDEGYRFLEEEDGSRGDDYLDVYSIPYLFYGAHEVKVTLEDMEDVEEAIQVGYDSSQYYLEAMQLKADIQEALIKKAGENMRQIYDAAITGKDFGAVKDLFTKDKETQQEIKEAYEYLMSEASQGDTRLQKMNLTNLTGTIYDSRYAAVNVTFEYAIEYIYEDIWSGETESDTYNETEECQIHFVKEDGNWVQVGLGCEMLYY